MTHSSSPMKKLFSAAVAACCLLAPAAPAVAEDAATSAPRLYVIVSIDQMRADYLTRYGSAWTGGLRRLMDGAASFPLAGFPYMNTVTCAGHATIGTGTVPAVHGMVLNQWYDRTVQKAVACTEDDSAPLIHYNGATSTLKAGNSGRRLLVSTFADELRAQSGVAPKVVGLSLKPRSAIGMTGHGGDLILWFDDAQGWTTSKAYASAPLPWLQEFIAAHPIGASYGTSWTRLRPEDTYLFDDDGVGEGQPNGWARTFPHAIASKSGKPDAEFNAAWQQSPLADAYLTSLAVEALDKMQLGQSATRRDVLAVSYSTLDIVGHAYGPRSHEVQDVLARLDLSIKELLDALDRKVGRGHYVLALTGDHGVSPIPEQMSGFGVDAVRVSLTDLRAKVEKAAEPFLGPGPHVSAVVYTDLYFFPGRYEKLVANPEAMQAVTAAILEIPGMARVYRGDLIGAGIVPEDGIAPAIAASYNRGRSGDLLMVPKTYSITSGSVATHGTLYAYDQRVPLLFYGAGVLPGNYAVPASPADIAPTFAHLAGVTLPRPYGRPRAEAFGRMTFPAAPGPRPTAAATPVDTRSPAPTKR